MFLEDQALVFLKLQYEWNGIEQNRIEWNRIQIYHHCSK